jgi:hypothetical protein
LTERALPGTNTRQQTLASTLGNMFSKKAMICRSCGHQAQPGKAGKGSLVLALVLWLGAILAFLLILPLGLFLGFVALVYTLWNVSSASHPKSCPACHGKETLISSDSPEGKRVAASYTTPPIVSR